MKKIVQKLIKTAILSIPALFIAWLSSLWLVPLAAMERGYTGAYGGEWLLIIAIFGGTYWAVETFLKSTLGSQKRRRKIPERRKSICKPIPSHTSQSISHW